MTEEELYQRIVSKYPSYAKIPQAELMPKIYAKYPSYQKSVEPMGSVDGQPTPVKRIDPNKGKAFNNFAFGGAPGAMTTPGSEDVLPMAGQIAGGMIPGVNAFGGAVAGATAGQAGRQGIRDLRQGKFGSTSAGPMSIAAYHPKEIAGEAAGTAAMEGLFRGIPRVLFPKQFGGKARELAGKKLGEIAANVEKKAPFANIAKNPFIDEIDTAFKENPFERGPAIQALANAKKKLLEMKQPLTFGQARQLEQQLGREAQFATDATQGHFTKAPKAPGLNKSIKGLRAKVSGKVDELAAQAGYPEFEGASRKFGELARKYPEKELQMGMRRTPSIVAPLIGGVGSFAPLAFGGAINPLFAAASLPFLIPEKAKTAIFRKAIDTPVGQRFGRTLTNLSTEGVRRLTQS